MNSIETDQTKSDRRKFLGSLAAGAGLLAALSALHLGHVRNFVVSPRTGGLGRAARRCRVLCEEATRAIDGVSARVVCHQPGGM